MSLKEEVQLLRQVPLFTGVDCSQLKLIAFTSQKLTFQEKDVICQQGDVGDAAYIIIKGTADILVKGATGNVKVATLGPNSILGEIALLRDIPRTATVVATSALTALKISKELFLNLLQEFPEISLKLLQELAKRLEETTAKL